MANLERVIREKGKRLDRVDEAFLHERTIDRKTYERQRDQLSEQIPEGSRFDGERGGTAVTCLAVGARISGRIRFGVPSGNRTRVSALKGPCPNRWTMGTRCWGGRLRARHQPCQPSNIPYAAALTATRRTAGYQMTGTMPDSVMVASRVRSGRPRSRATAQINASKGSRVNRRSLASNT